MPAEPVRPCTSPNSGSARRLSAASKRSGTEVEELTTYPASDLLDTDLFGSDELHEIIAQLNKRRLSLPAISGGRIRPPRPREREMLRLRLIEGLTLAEIGKRTGVSTERVRQLLNTHFGLTGARR